MEKCFIGIDGGGTKTALVSGLEDGTVISEVTTGSAAWRERGAANVATIISEAVKSINCGTIGGIAAGIPCYGESIEGDAAIETELKKVFPNIPLYLTNDVEVGWTGAFGLREGIHLVAGTGSIAYGVDSLGNSARSGGWDEFYSDEGSAYWIARLGMELFTKQSDGRAKKGPLLDIVRSEFGLSDDMHFIDFINEHYPGTRKARAAFQLLVYKAALAGDQAAIQIYADAASELFLMAQAVRQKLDMPTTGWRVSYSGGVFNVGEFILSPLNKLLEAKGGILCEPKHSPVIGSLLLAIDKFA